MAGCWSGLRVEVAVLIDERTSTPAIFKGPWAVSHPTCCCSVSLDHCDRRDLLVGLEGFHLVAAARREYGLVLDIESCDRCAGCPGCGVIAQGYGRVVVEVIDAPWAGVPVWIRWHKRRWMCRKRTCQTVTFLEHDERVCAPRARLGGAGDPLGNPTVALRGSQHCRIGSTTGNYVEYRVVPYQAVSASRI